MKKFTGFSKVGVIFGVLAVLLLGVFAYFVIDGINNATRFEDYNFNSIIGPTKDNGYIGDHVKGDKNAPVVIFEYADFQCSACAALNPFVNKAIEELDGKLAVVYRSYLLSYHPNAIAAASAAEAAGLQGYWEEYGEKLFNTQNEWYYATGNERTNLFNKYFTEVTNGQGDLEKFNQDRGSSEVAKKVDFDMGIGKRIDEINGTPSFFVDGQLIDWNNKNGSSITIGNETISWNKALTNDEKIDLLKKIVDAKLSNASSEQ